MFDKLLDDLYWSSKNQREPLREKYARVILRLSNAGKAAIFKETTTVIAWGVANMGGKTIFRIKDRGCDIELSYLSDSPFFGKFERKWTFPTDMEQDKIVDQVNIDIQKLFANDGLVSEGCKAIKEDAIITNEEDRSTIVPDFKTPQTTNNRSSLIPILLCLVVMLFGTIFLFHSERQIYRQMWLQQVQQSDSLKCETERQAMECYSLRDQVQTYNSILNITLSNYNIPLKRFKSICDMHSDFGSQIWVGFVDFKNAADQQVQDFIRRLKSGQIDPEDIDIKRIEHYQ